MNEWYWKVFTVILGVVVMPLAGWVWQTNLEVSQIRNDLGDLEEQVADNEQTIDEQEESLRTLIGVERDIQHIRQSLNRIEEMVTQ
jgi:cell division protein FtsL|tara:strand:+ start:2697 stop:2954 length:258 start_codon:yes stop_codon:yes gene_type:complete